MKRSRPLQPFEEIIETNKESIFRICRIYAVNPLEPEDLFQEVVFQAFKSFDSFKGQSSLSTWLYRVTLNSCMRLKHSHDKKNHSSLELSSIHFLNAEEAPEEERYLMLRECIDTLKEVERSIIILHLEEVAYREIAEITGLTENHVAVKMKRIKTKLSDCLTQKLGI